jgi:hypothetical protein
MKGDNMTTATVAEFQPIIGRLWHLTRGTEVQFRCPFNRQFDGKTAIIVEGASRRNQVRLHMIVEGDDRLNLRIPVSWVSGFRTNHAKAAEVLERVEEERPGPSKVKFGDIRAEAKTGDVVLFYRGGKHFDVGWVKEWRGGRVYCTDLLTGRVLGYKPEWYVGKVDNATQERMK